MNGSDRESNRTGADGRQSGRTMAVRTATRPLGLSSTWFLDSWRTSRGRSPDQPIRQPAAGSVPHHERDPRAEPRGPSRPARPLPTGSASPPRVRRASRDARAETTQTAATARTADSTRHHGGRQSGLRTERHPAIMHRAVARRPAAMPHPGPPADPEEPARPVPDPRSSRLPSPLPAGDSPTSPPAPEPPEPPEPPTP